MKRAILFLSLLGFCTVAFYAQANPKEFFSKYIKLGDDFDPSVASLYSDSAKIHTYRVYPHGLEREMELTGAQWKQLIVRAMPIAKAQNDVSKFSDIKYIETGSGYKVKANRYSVSKCYMDTGYYMIIKSLDDEGYQIVEEYMETQPESDC